MTIFQEFYKNFGGKICDINEINLHKIPVHSKSKVIGENIREHSRTLSLLASQQ